MVHYSSLFEYSFEIFFISLLMSHLIGEILSIKGIFLRGLLINFSISLAPAFYLVNLFIASDLAQFLDILSGFLFEFLLGILSYKFINQAILDSAKMNVKHLHSILKLTIGYNFFTTLPMIFMDGYGVFSDGGRSDYVFGNPIVKYFLYFGTTLGLVNVIVAGRLLSLNKHLVTIFFSVVFNVVISLLSGSKGGSILYLFTIIGFTSKEIIENRFFKRILISFFVLIIIAFFSTLFTLSTQLEIEPINAFNLMTSRILLNNDARALALDANYDNRGLFTFLKESFRSLSNLTGYPADNLPVGRKLYIELLGNTSDNLGANGSLGALIDLYFHEGFTVLIYFAMLLILLLLIRLVNKIKEIKEFNLVGIFFSGFVINLISLYSQDFLNSQLIVISFPIFLILILIINLLIKKRISLF